MEQVMNIIDIILLILLAVALIAGFRKGFVKQVISLAVLIVGAWLSTRLATEVSQWLGALLKYEGAMLNIVSFILIFLAVAILLNLIGKLIEKILKITMLGWLNRLLGMIVSVFKIAILLGIAVYLIDSLNNILGFIPKEDIASSQLYAPIKGVAETLFPFIKSLFQ